MTNMNDFVNELRKMKLKAMVDAYNAKAGDFDDLSHYFKGVVITLDYVIEHLKEEGWG